MKALSRREGSASSAVVVGACSGALLFLLGGCAPESEPAAGLVQARAASAEGDVQRTVADEANPCDSLVVTQCAFPFPNSYYLADDASTETGFRVSFPSGAEPRDRTGKGFDTTQWSTLDGFPVIPPILAHFPATSLRGMARHWDIDRSLDADSPSVLLDVDTGERVAHWAELDESGANDGTRSLIVWPTQALEYGHRYIMAFRDLEQDDGDPVQPSPAFRALRDGEASDDPTVEGRRAQFEEIFATLAQAGVERSGLQLAWDWTTVSEPSVAGWLKHMRDDALERVGRGGPAYQISEVIEQPNAEIFRQIEGRMRVPLYLSRPAPTAQSYLVLGDDGLPEFQGYTWAPFTVTIPQSVADAPAAAPVMQYGHGMFGAREEITYGWARNFFNSYGYVAAASDWWGMAAEDIPSVVITTLTDLSRFRTLPDRLDQGVVNALMLTELLAGDLVDDPALQVDGVAVLDASRLSYYGNSQGGILGGVFMAMSKRIERGVIGVGGSPYAMMLPRSANFAPYYEIFSRRYPSPLDQAILVAMMQMLWDRAEPAGFIHRMTDQPFADTPPHTLLFQTAIGDAQVPNLASDIYGRSVGAKLVTPYARDIWGMTHSEAPMTSSAYVECESGAPPVPVVNIPPDTENDTHEDPRRVPELQDQLHHFAQTGETLHLCDGPCDPN